LSDDSMMMMVMVMMHIFKGFWMLFVAGSLAVYV